MKRTNQSGQSIVQVLVGVAIASIAMAAITSMVVHQQKETRGLSEKLGSLETERVLNYALADGSLCSAELSDSALNPSAPYTINTTDLSANHFSLNSIHTSATVGSPNLIARGAQASPASPSLFIKTISVRNLVGSGITNQYLAELIVDFDETKLVRPIQPITFRLFILTNAVNQITGCLGGKVLLTNITHHSFCATGFAGTTLTTQQPNRFCSLTAVDDDVGNTVTVTGGAEFKCRVGSDGTHWRGYAPLNCAQVYCLASCFDIQ